MTESVGLRGTPGVALLLAVALVDRTGSGLFVPISVVYLHRTVGLSLTDIGLVLTLAGLAGTLAPLVSGRLLRRLDTDEAIHFLVGHLRLLGSDDYTHAADTKTG